MSKLFKYGKFSTISIVPKTEKLKNYDDYKKQIIEDPCKLIQEGEKKDPPYILGLSLCRR